MADDITDIVVQETVAFYIDVTVDRPALIEIVAPPIHMVEVEELGGPIGPMGPQGPLGPAGAQGTPGIGIVMKGSVLTYAYLPTSPQPNDGWLTQDTEHVWVWNGTEWVDCGVITGPTGDMGPAGPQGLQGPEGPQGATGYPGSDGAPGSTGLQGEPGMTGPQGPVGPVGSQGPSGLGINFKGQKANSAALPPTGNTVNDGWVMVDTGHTWVWTGTAWVDVGIISGPAGAQGIQGLQGVDGPQGPAGTQGIKGDTGDVGPIGPQGIQGPQGVQGIQGDTGLQGPQGPAGATETGASILAKLAPVDGAASGLDADKVDGLDSLYLLDRTNHTGFQAISTVGGLQAALDLKAPLASPALTGTPTAPTAATADSTTTIATTAFVKAQAYSTLASPTFTGDPKAPTPATADNDTSIATTAHVQANMALKANLAHTHAQADVTNLVADLALKSPLASPTFTGTPAAPTAAALTSTTQLATTAFVTAADTALGALKANVSHTHAQADVTNLVTDLGLKSPLASPTFTGTPAAPTAAALTSTTQLATTAFVTAADTALGALKANVSHTHAQADITNLTTDLGLKAPLASPALTGTPTAPTAAVLTNTTQVATTAFVTAADTALGATKEPTIAAGTAAQYWTGLKTWATHDKASVGLGSVDNTSDVAKPVSTATQTALNLKANIASPTFTGTVTTAASAAGGSGFNLPHGAAPTSPVNGDIWTTTVGLYARINGAVVGPYGGSGSFEPIIAAGTAAQYWQGTKTWQTLDKAAVGLGSVDNTTDLLKPISTATQTALNTKEPTLAIGTAAQYYRGDKSWQTHDKASVGLGSVDNTTDAAKPVSTAQQTALNLKANIASPTFTGKATVAASATGSAGFNVPHGVAPSAPADGDVWTTTLGVYVRANGVTQGPLGAGGEPSIAMGTTAQYWRGDKSWQTLDKAAVGLANVDNTTDLNKPVSTATQTALNLKANLAGPTFTGVPLAPTASAGTNTTQIATTAFVSTAMSGAGLGDMLKSVYDTDGDGKVNSAGTADTASAAPWTGITGKPATFPPTLPIAQADVTSLVADLALKAPLAAPTFTGIPAAPTAAALTSTTQLATTAFVTAADAALGVALKAPIASPTFTGKVTTAASAAGGAGLNLPNGAAPTSPVAGDIWTTTAGLFARIGAVTEEYAQIDAPTFTGIPAAPTAAALTSTTQLATTAFVTTADNLKANLASPTFTGTPAAPTAAALTSTTQIATTAFVTSALANYQLTSAKGANDGYASLDSVGKVPVSQLPAAVIGSVIYQGTWNASTNTPTIPSAVGTKGWYYLVAVPGNTLINGISDWAVNDWIISSGVTWDKVDNTDQVTSVAGRQGAVVLGIADVSGAAPLASPALTGTPTAPTAAALTNTTQLATTAFVTAADTALGALKANVSHTHAQADVTNLTTDLGLKAPLASPTFTGTPAAPTAAALTSTTQLATTAFVTAADTALGALKANVSHTHAQADVTNLVTDLGLKAPLASPTFTGTATVAALTATGKVTTAASAAGAAGIVLPHGAAPTTPVNGDIWTTTTGLFVRTNGVTQGPLGIGGEPAIATGTTAQYWRGDKQWTTLDKTAVGLANVDNTTDAAKPVSTATQTALNLKANIASPTFTGKVTTELGTTALASINMPHGVAPSAPVNGDMWTTTVGLYARINGQTVGPYGGSGSFEPIIAAGTTAQYWRGDKSWVALDKAAVGLANVDNTSDANKPVSTATATALSGKEPTIAIGTTAQYWRGDKSWQAHDKASVGLGSVDNTADTAKPVSTAQQTALNLKADLAGPTFTGVPAAPTAAQATNTTQLATTAFVQTNMALKANATHTHAQADVTSLVADLALKAPLADPVFTGTPDAPTAAALTSTTQIATTAFVTTADALKAPLADPIFTGTPDAPTAAPGTNTTQIATTAFVTTADALKANLAGPTTFTGVIAGPTPATADNTTTFATTAFVKAQAYATLADPTFTGTPDAPTAAPGTNTTQVATTAFVFAADALKANLASPTFTGVPAAPTPATGDDSTTLATTAFVKAQGYTSTSPNNIALTGIPTAPTAPASTNTPQIATTAFVQANMALKANVNHTHSVSALGGEPTIALGTTAQYWRGDKSWQTLDKAAVGLANVDDTSDALKPVSTATQTALNLKSDLASPTFTGVPAAPTAAALTSTTQLATTAFVTTANNLKANLASPALTGTPTAPTAATADSSTTLATTAFVKAQLYATLADPTFTGTPDAPTAAALTSTTQIATTAFVTAADTALGALKANVSHTHAQADVTNLVTDLGLKAPLASPALTGTPTAPTAATADNDTQIATTAHVQANMALKANLAHTHAQADVTNLVADLALKSPLASPTFTGVPAAPTAAALTSTTQLATTAFVTAADTALGALKANVSHTHAQADVTNLVADLGLKAPLAGPTFTGVPAAPTAAALTSTTQLATTAFVTTADNLKANLASPTFTGTPAAPTPATADNTTTIATTAFVKAQAYAPLASPTFTGVPAAPTATPGTNTTQVATTAFVFAGDALQVTKAGDTMTGKLTTLASAAGTAGLTLPHGAAPTSPVNGDLWTTTAGLYARINAVTLGPIGAAGEPTIPLGTTAQYWRGDKSWQSFSTAVAAESINWSQIINEPTTFPPTLPIAQGDVTNLTSDLAAKVTDAASDSKFYVRRNAAWEDLFKTIDPMTMRQFEWRTEIVAPPTTGQMRLNNATVASATAMWLFKTDMSALSTALVFPEMIVVGARLAIVDQDDPTAWHIFRVTSALVDSTTYWTVPVALDGTGGVAIANASRSTLYILPADASLYAPLASPTFTGIPAAPTAAALTSTTQLATTAFVTTADNLKANLAGPTFTGVPAAPTAAALTNTTQIATTAFVTTADNLKANLASPTFTGVPAAPTAAALTNTTQLATTQFVTTADLLKAPIASPTFTGKVTMELGTTALASLNMPHGVAPSAPVNGDMWTTTLGVYARINAVTIGPLADQAYVTTAGALKVTKAGDTMTGSLTIAPATGNASLFLNKFAAAQGSDLWGQQAGKNRWLMRMGDTTAEAGSNAGSDFTISRYDDAGTTQLGTALTISRSVGTATFETRVIAGTTMSVRGTTGNIHMWWYGPADEDRAVIYTSAATMGNLNVRVNGTQTFAFYNDGRFYSPAVGFLGSMGCRTVFISGADPSGGVDGDVWLKVV